MKDFINMNIFNACFKETYKVSSMEKSMPKNSSSNSLPMTKQPSGAFLKPPGSPEDSMDSDSSTTTTKSANSSPSTKFRPKFLTFPRPARSNNTRISSARSMGSTGSTSSESVVSSDDAASTCSSGSLRSSPEPLTPPPEERVPSISSDEECGSSGRRPSATDGAFSETHGLTGLRNIGNTCFLNSIIQCMSNTRCVLEYIVQDHYLSDINTSSLSTMKGDLMRAFASLIKEMWTEGDSNRAVNTGPFKTQVQRFAPVFTGFQQHDAQEFLRKLLEGLHEDVNRVTVRPKPLLTDIDDNLSEEHRFMEAWKRYLRLDNSPLVDMFVGVLGSRLRCSRCNHASLAFDPFWDLSLELPSKTPSIKIEQCLDRFTADEVLDGDERPTCSKCKERVRMTKSFSIQKFPKVLVLHLKRFSPTERWRGKLSNLVEFPLENLDLSKYASNSRSTTTYNLIGVSNHSGTTYGGHYMAYCRHPYKGSWHEYNDSRVSSMTTRKVCSPEAYVLFYELCSPL